MAAPLRRTTACATSTSWIRARWARDRDAGIARSVGFEGEALDDLSAVDRKRADRHVAVDPADVPAVVRGGVERHLGPPSGQVAEIGQRDGHRGLARGLD